MANEQYPAVLAPGQSHGVGFLHSWGRHTNNPALAIDSDLHGENAVFPEYRDLITQLKTTDSYFLNVYEKHNELDQRIRNMESGIEPATHLVIEALKKEKLALKDELYQILRKASA
jgi:uncharacterized protein YdcH (DUF465 family)